VGARLEFKGRRTRRANNNGNFGVMGGGRTSKQSGQSRQSRYEREMGRSNPRVESAHIVIPRRTSDTSGLFQIWGQVKDESRTLACHFLRCLRPPSAPSVR